MSSVPGKIVLKSSTSKTLSERFGELAKTSHAANIRSKQRDEYSASIKNKRLAAQMAKRLGDSFEENLTSERKPVKTRLSLPITSRLGNRGRRGQAASGRTQRQQTSAGNSPLKSGGVLRGRRGTRGRGGLRQRGGGRGGQGSGTGTWVKRGRGGGRGGTSRGVTRGGTSRGVTRGKANSRGGRGRGSLSGKPVTQAQLDKELDQYMSKTKSALNAELDQYMKAASK